MKNKTFMSVAALMAMFSLSEIALAETVDFVCSQQLTLMHQDECESKVKTSDYFGCFQKNPDNSREITLFGSTYEGSIYQNIVGGFKGQKKITLAHSLSKNQYFSAYFKSAEVNEDDLGVCTYDLKTYDEGSTQPLLGYSLKLQATPWKGSKAPKDAPNPTKVSKCKPHGEKGFRCEVETTR